MIEEFDLEIAGQSFTLFADKLLIWKEPNFLLLSDVHAGKASHFRKHGIPLSSDYLLRDLNKLEASIKRLKPSKVFVLGDLFHSDFNEENALVVDWIANLDCPFCLISGNHDIHSNSISELENLSHFELDGIRFIHDPFEISGTDKFVIGGHIHPRYRIQGKARQNLSFPCFHISKNKMILPAFGQLTGGKNMKKNAEDIVVLVTEEGLINLP